MTVITASLGSALNLHVDLYISVSTVQSVSSELYIIKIYIFIYLFPTSVSSVRDVPADLVGGWPSSAAFS